MRGGGHQRVLVIDRSKCFRGKRYNIIQHLLDQFQPISRPRVGDPSVPYSPLPGSYQLSSRTMAPQKSVTEVPRSILPRLTWNGSSARTTVTSPQTTALSAKRQPKQHPGRSWIPAGQLHTLTFSSFSRAGFPAVSREVGTSSSIARRFPSAGKATSRPAAEPLGNPIRHNGVYVATFNPARRAFHASAPHQRDHHFDTLKFVQRLKDEGFSEEQAVAMMRVLNDVIQESIQNLTRTMVLREG